MDLTLKCDLRELLHSYTLLFSLSQTGTYLCATVLVDLEISNLECVGILAIRDFQKIVDFGRKVYNTLSSVYPLSKLMLFLLFNRITN